MAPTKTPMPAQPSGKSVLAQIEARVAKIEPHTCISACGESLSLHLDFSIRDSNLWYGIDSPEFITQREIFFGALREYYGLSKRIDIYLNFPRAYLQTKDVKFRQRDFMNRLSPVIDAFPNLKAVGIVFSAPKLQWAQVQVLAPFYGMKFSAWTCTIEEHGQQPVDLLLETRYDFDRRLASVYWKMKARKELAWQHPSGKPEVPAWPIGKPQEW